jgi:hypothetical protein
MSFTITNRVSLQNKQNAKTTLFGNATLVLSLRLRIETSTRPCIRLKRSSDSALQDFYADASGNLGTELGATGTSVQTWLGASTGYVAIWYNQTGDSNNDFIQDASGAQPIFSLTNGVVFDGANDYLETSAFTATLNTTNFTIMSSFTNFNLGAYGTVISSRNNEGGTLKGYTLYKMGSEGSDYINLMISAGTGVWNNIITNIVGTVGTPFVTCFNVNATGNALWSLKNKSTSTIYSGQINANGYKPSTTTIKSRVGAGKTETTPSFYFNGYIKDIFYFKTNIDSTTQTTALNLLY